MPRDGSNVYNLPSDTAAISGQTISSTKFNSITADIAADLNTERPVVAGGTGAANAATARSNLGVVIGTDVQAYDPLLAAIAALVTTADRLMYFTGSDTVGQTDLTAFGRSLLGVANEAAFKTLVNLEAGTDFNAYQADQAESVWETGTGTTASRVSPAHVAAAISALSSGPPSAVLEDQKTSGTAGGTATGSTWNTRDLNTEVYDPNSLITLSANRFTPSVNGWVEFSAPTYAVNGHKTRLYNVTDSTVAGVGSTEYVATTEGVMSRSCGGCAVTASKQYELQHYAANTRASNGLGLQTTAASTVEVYSRVLFWRT